MAIFKPSIEANINALRGLLANEPFKVLFVGQKTTGTSPAGELVENIGNNGQEDDLFGENSMLAAMVRGARSDNTATRFDAIPLDDDGGATAAEFTVTFTGPATEDGTLDVIVGSGLNHRYTLTITSADTATDVAVALVAAITADPKVPVTAANVAGVVTLTAVNAGAVLNTLGVRVIGAVAGVTSTVAQSVTGATNPSLTGVFDPIEGERYHTIVWPYIGVGPTFADLSVVSDFLDDRLNVPNRILDGAAYSAYTNTLAIAKSVGDSQNSSSLVVVADQLISETEYLGPAKIELDYVVASLAAAKEARLQVTGANVSDLVIAQPGSEDLRGGVHQSSKPLFNKPYPEIALADIGDEWTDAEELDLNDSGVSVLGNNPNNVIVISSSILTTRKTDQFGNPETVFKYLPHRRTASAIREFMVNNLRNDYGDSRLTPGEVIPNYNQVNEALFSAALDKYYSILSGEGFLLTVKGDEALTYFKENKQVSFDFDTSTANVTLIVPIVSQFRNAVIDMFFTTSFSQV